MMYLKRNQSSCLPYWGHADARCSACLLPALPLLRRGAKKGSGGDVPMYGNPVADGKGEVRVC